MNKNLFKTNSVNVTPANTTNEAGGVAYSFTNEHALAQYVVTGCFNGTYYASAEDQLAKIKELVDSVDSKFIAQTAVYGHEVAKMKDMPAFLLAVLAARGEVVLLSQVFDRVITNAKMLCNFVQIIRSGTLGRKSFGTAVKRLINNWFTSRSANALFNASVGHSNPSLADIIKMTHPHAKDAVQNAMFGYILGKNVDVSLLPQRVQLFEALKKNSNGEVPDVDFRLLSNLTLDTEQWKKVTLAMPWNTLRMNLQNVARHGVFGTGGQFGRTKGIENQVAHKLCDKEEVLKWNVFPYQLLTAYKQLEHNSDVPQVITNAIQVAVEHATGNVPSFDTETAVCIDVSGSMQSPVTGYRAASTNTTCVDVAALIAACVVRRNPVSEIISFDTSARKNNINPMDSIMTNAKKLAANGGGTDCSTAIRHLNRNNSTAKVIIMVSDNQSWVQYHDGVYSHATGMGVEWALYKKRVKDAKIVLIDLQPYATTQLQDNKDVLNIGGWSDGVWEVINNFIKFGGKNFVDIIKGVSI